MAFKSVTKGPISESRTSSESQKIAPFRRAVMISLFLCKVSRVLEPSFAFTPWASNGRTCRKDSGILDRQARPGYDLRECGDRLYHDPDFLPHFLTMGITHPNVHVHGMNSMLPHPNHRRSASQLEAQYWRISRERKPGRTSAGFLAGIFRTVTAKSFRDISIPNPLGRALLARRCIQSS